MRLIRYELRNFKAFEGPESIPIRPITLIYGQNSSGKSSLLQSLLLLKQTFDESEDPETLLLPKGNLIDVGSYREFVHRHNTSSCVSFKATFHLGKSPSPGGYAWLRQYVKLLDQPEASLEVSLAYDEASSKPVLSHLDYFLGRTSEPALTYAPSKLTSEERSRRRWRFYGYAPRSEPRENVLQLAEFNAQHSVWKAVHESHGQKLAASSLPRVARHLEVLKARVEAAKTDNDEAEKKATRERMAALEALAERLKDYTLARALEDMEAAYRGTNLLLRNFLPYGEAALESMPNPFAEDWEYGPLHPAARVADVPFRTAMLFRELLENLTYIGPLRDSPERYYIYGGAHAMRVGKSGRYVPDVLFKDADLLRRVNEQLEKFEFGYQLRASSIREEGSSEASDVFALRLMDKTTGVHSSILDVGFGVSQVLPVIVQSMLSSNGVLCMEQPEIHLHPKLQAELGTLFAACTKPPYSNTFVVESHSEALILRLQKLIRAGTLKPEDVAVIYVDRGQRNSRCTELRLDQDGDFIDKWPGGFFEDGYREMFG